MTVMEKCGIRIDAESRCVLEKGHQREGELCSSVWIAREIRQRIIDDMWALGERLLAGRRGYVRLTFAIPPGQ
jgi:hypothetical protein